MQRYHSFKFIYTVYVFSSFESLPLPWSWSLYVYIYIGIIFVAFFAENFGVGIERGIFFSNNNSGTTLLKYQIYAILFVTLWSTFWTFFILKIIDRVIGLRVSVDEEEKGLDLAIHDETLVLKRKTESFWKYSSIKGTEPQSKYEKYQNMVGKYLTWGGGVPVEGFSRKKHWTGIWWWHWCHYQISLRGIWGDGGLSPHRWGGWAGCSGGVYMYTQWVLGDYGNLVVKVRNLHSAGA